MLLWSLLGFASAAPVTVCQAGGCDYTNLAAALNDPSADPITVADAETYPVAGFSLSRDVEVTATTTTDGTGRPLIDMQGGGGGITVEAGNTASFTGFDVLRRYNGWSFQVETDASLTLDDMDFLPVSQTVWVGGAHLRIFGGSATVRDSVFREASGGDYGSHMWVHNGGDLDVEGSTFTDGTMQDPQRGGSIACTEDSSLTVTDSSFSNMDNELGGALHLNTCTATVVGGAFFDNLGGRGGHIYAYRSDLTVVGTTFGAATAANHGDLGWLEQGTSNLIDLDVDIDGNKILYVRGQPANTLIDGGSWSIEGQLLDLGGSHQPTVIRDTQLDVSGAPVILVRSQIGAFDFTGNEVCSRDGLLLDIAAGLDASIDGNLFVVPPTAAPHAFLFFNGDGTGNLQMTSNTIVGPSGVGVASSSASNMASAMVANNIFAGIDPGVPFVGGPLTTTNSFFMNNGFEGNAQTPSLAGGWVGPTDSVTDPSVGLATDPAIADCGDPLYLGYESAFHDAGSTTATPVDNDGSLPDLGAHSHHDPDGDGYVTRDDCDETDRTVNPGAAELCDGVDNDCNGIVDTDAIDQTAWWPDADLDGFGDMSVGPTVACQTPFNNTSTNGDDCNDADDGVHPDADEVCNDIDDDCNGNVDDGLSTGTWYKDEDGDGFGDPDVVATGCDQPANSVPDDTDCNDTEEDVFPGADERCNGIDDDCDGVIDVGAIDAVEVFIDEDGDGWGDETLVVCDGSLGVMRGGDCDDDDAAVNPDAEEVPDDALDNDCTDSEAVTSLTGGSGAACGCSGTGRGGGWLWLVPLGVVATRRAR